MEVQWGNNNWTLNIKTTVFNSGLGTIGPLFLLLEVQYFYDNRF